MRNRTSTHGVRSRQNTRLTRPEWPQYDLLKVLVHHTGNVRTHHQLIRELWGRTQYQDAGHLLRVTLSHLRRKLRSDPIKLPYMVTERGVGYQLRTESADYPGMSSFARALAPSGVASVNVMEGAIASSYQAGALRTSARPSP